MAASWTGILFFPWALIFPFRFSFFPKLKVNICQNLLFLHQLTHNISKDCSLIYHENYKLRTCCVHKLFWMSKQNKKIMHVHNMFWSCSFRVRTRKSMNILLSYFGLVDAKIRASDKDLPVFSPPRSSMVEETTALLSSLDGSCSFLLDALK